MKQIPLNSKRYLGKVAIIDDEDYELIKNYAWYPYTNTSNNFYAAARNKDNRMVLFHRIIMGLTHGDGLWVDHINGNGLDNRRCNLRLVTPAQNMYNIRGFGKTSRYKGVSYVPKSNRWVAQIGHNNTHKYLGLYVNEVDAAKSYDKAAMKLFGEYARPNFPETPLNEVKNLPKPPQGKQYTSTKIGVDYENQSKKWRARISINKKRIELGYFNDVNNAILVREIAEKLYRK